MTYETPKFSYKGTIDEWMDELPGGLEDEPVGMWEIAAAGRDFGLDGEELIAFMRRAVRKLLDDGARPVERDTRGPYYWAVQTHYGKSADEIVENTIVDWPGWGYADSTHVGLRFASPEDCKLSNLSVSEWLDHLASRLGGEAISASEILLAGEYDYELVGDDLVRFVEDVVRRLLEHGALPVDYNLEGPHEFTIAGQYGNTTEEVVSNVSAAWTASQDPRIGGLYFATPKILEARRD